MADLKEKDYDSFTEWLNVTDGKFFVGGDISRHFLKSDLLSYIVKLLYILLYCILSYIVLYIELYCKIQPIGGEFLKIKFLV